MIKWIILLLMPILSYSHPGPTDSRGGHWDNSTGSHHYHNKTPYIPPKLNTFFHQKMIIKIIHLIIILKKKLLKKKL